MDDHYYSIRSVERAPGERFTMAQGEHIASVSPGYNGRLIVWIVNERDAPEVPVADRTPEGERVVTEEVGDD